MSVIATPTLTPADLGSESGSLIDVDGVWKAFGATQALADVTVGVDAGEVRALVGRNGAGKSTLVSLLTGIARPDTGEIRIAGVPVHSARSAIGCVYQDSRLVPALTVAENVVFGQHPRTVLRTVDWRLVQREAEQHLESWGLSSLARALAENLDPVQAKVVQICRALVRRPRVLLLDEPTAGLDRRDAGRLFEVVDQLKAHGVTIVYVSHHLSEIYRLCDTVTILRDGRHVLTAPLKGLTMDALVSGMVGDAESPLTSATDRRPRDRRTEDAVASTANETRLQIRGLSLTGAVEAFDLDVACGECVGIAGLEGSGKAEIGAMLAGLLRPGRGRVTVDGRKVRLGDVRSALRSGISYVPPERQSQGIVPQLSVAENATLAAARALARQAVPFLPFLLLERDRVRLYRRLADQWKIVAASHRQPIGELSGGNQQKCVIARGLATDPSVLVLHRPTAGIDVAARASITRTLEQVLSEGACCVVISDDVDDLALCGRVAIVFKGRLTQQLGPEWTEQQLVAAMQGEQIEEQ
jgi:simple sugar transport system ATP-binding protein